jgi:predicted alpha/beta-hydrolase family hydrolase
MSPRGLAIALDGGERVSALLQAPEDARAALVLAHGAGAGMTHPFMTAIATALAERGIATLRYQFPSMEKRSKRPDPPKIAQATVRAAVEEAARRLSGVPLFAGGKSFGGRMTSQAQAASPLAGIRGLVFLGFPLHPAGKPSTERAEHLFAVEIPMLFLQGTRDALADLSLLQPIVERLGAKATLRRVDDADHSFHVRGHAPGEVDAAAGPADEMARWIDAATSRR